MKEEIIVLITHDASKISDFRRCPEYYRQRHVLGLVADGDGLPGILQAGSVTHNALWAWFDQPSSALALEAGLKVISDEWPEDPLFPKEPVLFTKGYVKMVFEGYAEKWPREKDDFLVVGNEEYLKATLPAGNEVCGLVDRRILRGGDKDDLFIMDTKNTQSAQLFARMPDGFALSTQMRGYLGMLKAHGHNPRGVYIDGVYWGTRRVKPPLVKPGDFKRQYVRYNQDQIDGWARDFEYTLGRIVELGKSHATGRWPQYDTACYAFNKPCQFLERCKATEEEAAVMEGYREDRWEPHLKS